MSVVKNPIEQYFDVDGSPLASGYIYYGTVNGNPETSPVQVYWDSGFTNPAAQPIRTTNGYPSRLGAPSAIYSNQDVSVTVKNKKGALVFYQPTSSLTSSTDNIVYRTSNTLLISSDNGKQIIARSSFTQTFDAASALGSSWSINYFNASSGDIILDPNLSELINGATTYTLPKNTNAIISCNGVGFTISISGILSADIQAQTYTYFTTGGTSTAYTLTPSPAIGSLVAGQRFSVKFNVTAGATPTLAISGLTAKNLMVYDSTGAKVAASATSIVANMIADVIYDGTDYVAYPVMSPATTKAALKTQITDDVPMFVGDFATGSAPMYMYRAWCVFDGTGTVSTNQTIKRGGNITSVFKNGTGDYTITMAIAMPTVDYGLNITSTRTTNTLVGALELATTPTTSVFRIRIATSDANTATNSTYIFVGVVY